MENSNLEEQRYIRAKKKVKAIKGFYVHLTVYILVNAFLILARVFSRDAWDIFGQWQTYNTAIFWGIGIAFHAFNVFGMYFILGSDWEEKKIKEMMDKDKRDLWE